MIDIKSKIDSHKIIVFQFSGGKDSIACLILLKDYLHKIIVLWTNSGDEFPETIAQMEMVKLLCPNFIEVKGRQKEQIEMSGYPADVVPMRNHVVVQYYTQTKAPKIQSFMECCVSSVLNPMNNKTIELGATLVIRGQKLSDKMKSPVVSGNIIDGIEFLFPIEDWDDKKVMEFVSGSELLPIHYSFANTSLDCMLCTAYLRENQWKMAYMRENHPKQATELKNRIAFIRKEVANELKFMGVQ